MVLTQLFRTSRRSAHQVLATLPTINLHRPTLRLVLDGAQEALLHFVSER